MYVCFYYDVMNIMLHVKIFRLLISLSWEGDAAWTAITSRKDYLMDLMNKVKDHFKQKEEQETIEKGIQFKIYILRFNLYMYYSVNIYFSIFGFTFS